MSLNSLEVSRLAKAGVERTADESSSLYEAIQNLHISTTPEAAYDYSNNSTTRRSLRADSLLQTRESANKNRPDKTEKEENSKVRYTKVK